MSHAYTINDSLSHGLPEFARPRLPHRSYSFSVGEVRPLRKADTARILTSLYSSTSPLISENLKVSLCTHSRAQRRGQLCCRVLVGI